MSILERDALEDSPLADLHAIASALSIDGYRRLRRSELIDAIMGRQEAADRQPGPSDAPPETVVAAAAEQSGDHREGVAGTRRRRARRAPRSRGDERGAAEQVRDELRTHEDAAEANAVEVAPSGGAEEAMVEGIVDLLPGGSGFVRVNPPETSDDDVYISAAQVKRCELVPGDRVSGPRRSPRRSERFASLIRVDTINGRPADEVVDSTRYDELPASFPHDRFRLGSEDPTVKAIEWLTPFGRGSRVAIVGPAQAGKTEALRRLAAALSAQEAIHLSLVLAGIRPEEEGDWTGIERLAPAAALTFDASADAQAQAVEGLIDQARRLASRGADAVVLIDSLDGLHPGAARKALGAARKIVDGGSLTVIATATTPVGSETTVIALDRRLTGTGRFPALDLTASWTMRPELLVGEAGAEAILATRAQVLD